MVSRRTTWLLALGALVSIAATQGTWDYAAAGFKSDEHKAALKLAEPALPSYRALTFLSLNDRSAVADLLWLQSIQYFGQGNPYGQYPSLGKILDTITELDPHFTYPAQFAMTVLPFMGQTQAAVTIGERGHAANPSDALITFYLASVYHLNVKDYKRAGDLYNLSAEQGGPGASKELAGVAYASAHSSISDRVAAIEFWKAVYDNATDTSEKERAAKWFDHMQTVYSIELAAGRYKQNTGHFPADIQTLVSTGYLATTPVSAIGRILVLDPNTGIVDFSQG